MPSRRRHMRICPSINPDTGGSRTDDSKPSGTAREGADSAPVHHDHTKQNNDSFQFSGVDDSPPFEITLPSPTSMSGFQPCLALGNPQSDVEHPSMGPNPHDDAMNWEVLQSFLNSPPSMMIEFQPDKRSDDDGDSSSSRHFQLPSLNEIRALNGNARDNPDGPTQIALDSRFKKVLAEFGDLLSSVFSTEAEIAGLSSAVADYLSWARKSPDHADYPAVLQVLETRVRELNQLASTRYWAAFKHMRASFGRDECIQEHLRSLETGLIDQNVKTMQFFHEDYDISSPLAEQRE
ncbi:hypothetical protein HJFPF1_05761 [Paramyrothecium foliicola]|nr:hypothetical protein HJFPF1_05761 [Paramyrothecium foliicola]